MMEGVKEVKGRGREVVRDKEVNKEVNKSLGKLQRSRWKCVGHPPERLVGIA